MSKDDQEPVANDRRPTATLIGRKAYSIQIAGGDHGVIDMPELHGCEALALRDELCRWFGLPEDGAAIAKEPKVAIDPDEYLRAQRENAMLKLELEKQLSSKPAAINGFQESTPASAERQTLKAERDEALQRVEELEAQLAKRDDTEVEALELLSSLSSLNRLISQGWGEARKAARELRQENDRLAGMVATASEALAGGEA